MKYALWFEPVGIRGYYTGKTYIVAGEKYVCSTDDKSKAKIYTSHKRAENAAEVLMDTMSCFTYPQDKIKIVEIE